MPVTGSSGGATLYGGLAVDLPLDGEPVVEFGTWAEAALFGAQVRRRGDPRVACVALGIPVVRRAGGLADTVTDADRPCGTGFVFDGCEGSSLSAAVHRALDCRAHRPAHWAALVRQAMARDASWSPSARQYVALYRTLVPAVDQAQPAEHATSVH